MIETQQSIEAWATSIWGAPPPLFNLVVRANEELAELLAALAHDAPAEEAVEEAADVVIVLAQIGAMGGGSALDFVEDEPATSGYSPPCDYAMTAHQAMSRLFFGVRFGGQSYALPAVSYAVRQLAYLARVLGLSLGDAIDRKMQINRGRDWTQRGYHLRPHDETAR